MTNQTDEVVRRRSMSGLSEGTEGGQKRGYRGVTLNGTGNKFSAVRWGPCELEQKRDKGVRSSMVEDCIIY